MPTRQSLASRGADHGHALVRALTHQAESARIERGTSFADIGRALGVSDVQAARLCRGRSPNLSIVRASQLLAVLGLALSARAYPVGAPIRDAAQLRLLERLRVRLPTGLNWRTEVPVIELAEAGISDRRAWDAVIEGSRWTLAVEAETRSNDVQALQRRIALKQRDGAVDAVLLLLADTRHHRELARLAGVGLAAQFPTPPRRALRALAAGSCPASNALVFL